MGILPDWMIRERIKITPFAEGEKRPGIISYGLSSYGYDARVGHNWKIFSNTFCGVVDPKAIDENSFVSVSTEPLPHEWTRNPQQTMREPRNPVCGRCGVSKSDIELHNAPMFCFEPSPFVLIPPNSFVLAESVEHFEIPRDVLAICLGKSSYARCGIIVNVTPLEPEWSGKVTIEISNTTPLPSRVHAGEGIMQIIFLETAGVTSALLKTMRRITERSRNEGDTVLHEFLEGELGIASCQKSYKDKNGKYDGQTGLTMPKVD